MSNSVEGRTAIVTGAGRGVGLAIARQLHEYGANVMLADCDESGLEQEIARFGDPSRARRFSADMSQRLSMAGPITHAHLLASSAIPFVFPATGLPVAAARTADGAALLDTSAMPPEVAIAAAIALVDRQAAGNISARP